MDDFIKKAIRVVELVVTLMMGIVVGIVIAEVFARGLFNTSLIITDEVSRYVMVWTAMLAAVLLVHENGHMQISIVSSQLRGRSRAIVEGVGYLIAAAFAVMIIVTTLQIFPSLMRQNMITLGIPIAWAYAAMPVAALLILPLLLRKAWCSFRGDTPNDLGS